MLEKSLVVLQVVLAAITFWAVTTGHNLYIG